MVEVWCTKHIHKEHCGSSLADYSVHSRCMVEQFHLVYSHCSLLQSLDCTRPIINAHAILNSFRILITPQKLTFKAMNMLGKISAIKLSIIAQNCEI